MSAVPVDLLVVGGGINGVGIARDAAGPLVAAVQTMLAGYGYGIEATGGFDPRTEFVVKAFQRHFRPERVDGRIDQSTVATLERLIAALPTRSPA